MKRVLFAALAGMCALTAGHANPPCPGCKEIPDHYGVEIAGMKLAPVLMVLDVRPNSGAEKAGLGPLDLILAVLRDKGEMTLKGIDHQDFQREIENEARKSGAMLDILKYQKDGSYLSGKARLLLNREPGGTPDFATRFSVVVTEVVPGSPAERAGIQPWDSVESFNGNSVPSMTPVSFAVALDEAIRAGGADIIPAEWKLAGSPTLNGGPGIYTKKRLAINLKFGQQ